ncbi:HGGxSTG domain-containing protein [Gloeobacter kilaueensis]|uniref:Uncharacterized protein n=1 Tax=Gloeobacter kilaueensis (strain ATCC BAA-2537 / CCAP 1431/1 / ULC 316 / JS1) TaxID=1183438 RepID=U5QDL7_GLOK1|nr:HGGxSTG domain-containing protein [Gloeobacter kilaueensis]AGY57032.1 hypothetical protein GKIL_0786 [Gloeobacter kilaueensis JS1]
MNSETPQDPRRCGAKNGQGQPCRNYPVPGARRCKFHGGASLAGPSHPSFKHGRYSKFLPERLRDRMAAAMADPDLLNLSAEVALIDVRVQELLEKLDTGEAPRLWSELGTITDRLERAERARDAQAFAKLLDELVETIRRGSAAAAAWSEVANLLDRRRKIVDAEGKRQARMKAFVKVDEAMAVIAVVADSVNRHVIDPVARRAISEDLAAVVNRPAAAESDDEG